jgi:hypothetical protein
MDPMQTLRDAESALRSGDLTGCRTLLRAYFNWRAMGGFEPDSDSGWLSGDERADWLLAWCATVSAVCNGAAVPPLDNGH